MTDKTNKVINTMKEAQENPAGTSVEAMFRGSSSAIDHMEAEGTMQLVESSVLPTQGLHVTDWAEKVGIKILKPVADDPVFTHVELPKGWRQETTDHNMWNKLVDDQGRERASIFYKAAFYDRSAYISPVCRYRRENKYFDESGPREGIQIVVTDGGKAVLFESLIVNRGDYVAQDKLNANAVKWLKDQFPKHEDPAAYWDE